MISLKRIFCTCCLLLSVWAVFAQGPSEWKALEKPLNFYLANDLGRNGYYDQKPIEKEKIPPRAIITKNIVSAFSFLENSSTVGQHCSKKQGGQGPIQ